MVELIAQELKHEIKAYEDFCEFRKSRPKADAADKLETRRQSLQERMRRRRGRERQDQRDRPRITFRARCRTRCARPRRPSSTTVCSGFASCWAGARPAMGVTELFGATAGVVAGCMLTLWLLSLALRDASIADIFWGLGFAVIAVLTFLWTDDGSSARRGLIAALVSLWGLRLAAYLLWRNTGRGEDPRYVAMRRYWGPRFWWISLFSVFALQGVLLWIVSLPVQLGQLAAGARLGALDAVGLALFSFGLSFEAVGDWQLARFKADPSNAGRVMDQGLWRYTRHPNYFGDFCVWWGLFVVALSTPYGIWSAIGPVLMTFLLMRVSGVPLLERNIHKRRPDYVEYAKRTSAFFPRPPRQPSE